MIYKKELFLKEPQMKTEEAALESIQEQISVLGDISLGTDIEVLWLTKTTLLDESTRYGFFPADNLFVRSGVFGTDGRTLQGEWRFTPSYDPNVLLKIAKRSMTLCKTYAALQQRKRENIPSIIPYGMGIYSMIEEEGLEIPESIGLHIHFGNCNIRNYEEKCVAALDLLLTPVIKLFEPLVGYHIRSNCGFYGDLSDYEQKTYGLEYKTLPSCVDDPEVFIGTFALAKAIAFEAMSDTFSKKFLSNFKVKSNELSNKKYLRWLAKQSKLLVQRKCRYYYVYKNEIDRLYELALKPNADDLFCTGEDIFSRWNITCDFSNQSLVENLDSNIVLTPLANPIEGNSGEVSEDTIANCFFINNSF